MSRYTVKGLLSGSARVHALQEEVWETHNILVGLLRKHEVGVQKPVTLVSPSLSRAVKEGGVHVERVYVGEGKRQLQVLARSTDAIGRFDLENPLPLHWVPLVHQSLTQIIGLIATGTNDALKDDIDFIMSMAEDDEAS